MYIYIYVYTPSYIYIYVFVRACLSNTLTHSEEAQPNWQPVVSFDFRFDQHVVAAVRFRFAKDAAGKRRQQQHVYVCA